LSSFPFELEEIVEGKTRLLVPKVRTHKGPGKRAGAFYNEVMRANRDVSVLAIGTIQEHEKSSLKVLDGLASTGALGVRLANELEGPTITMNERNPVTFELIKKNLELNNISNEKTSIENLDLNVLLHKRKFEYIDIDPYGSPVPFLDDAFQAVYRKGYVSATATDKAPLSGVYPKACFRKYLGRPLRTEYSDEIGLRILLGYCARTAAKHEIGVKPLLSYSHQHYFKVYLRTEQGAKKADNALKNIGYVHHDKTTGERSCSESLESDLLNAGPLWIGPLMDSDFVAKLKPRSHFDENVLKMVALWKQEADAPPLYYTTDELAGMLRINPPPLDRFMERLRAGGFRVSRTHFSPTAIKTDASLAELKESIKT
jgi:tRNA (guanine26-N2/guanine27-N2)-dimethyltransferase